MSCVREKSQSGNHVLTRREIVAWIVKSSILEMNKG
jgi:hypothetical protein